MGLRNVSGSIKYFAKKESVGHSFISIVLKATSGFS